MSLIKKFFKENLKTNETFEKTGNEQPKNKTQIENVNMQVEERKNTEQTSNSVIDEVKSYIKSNAALFKVESECESNIWFSYVCVCLPFWLLHSFYLCFWNVIS